MRFATGAAGVRYQGRTDVMLALFDAAGGGRRRLHPLEVPLGAGRLVPRRTCREGRARALVVNSGNANAFTGAAGVATTTAGRQGDGEGDRRGAERGLSWPRPA